MFYYIFDFLVSNILNINISLFLFKIHKIKILDFLYTIIFIILSSCNIELVISMILIFLLNKIIYKLLNYKLINALITYSLYYLILSSDYHSLLINLLFVIILYKKEYKVIGDNNDYKILYKKSFN